MSKLDDIFGSKYNDKNWIEVHISISCLECGENADEAYASKNKKQVRTVHHVDGKESHVVEADFDWSWMSGQYGD